MPVRRTNRKPATLKDVARAAGVSLSTVSYVLNNSPHVARISPPTRQRVLAAMERLGYRRDPIGAALQRGYTNQVILLIVTWNLATAHAATALAISRAATARGLELTVHVAEDDAAAEAFLKRRVLHNLGGLLVLWDSPAMRRSGLEQLAELGVPVVDLLPGESDRISVVTVNREEAFFQATRYLIGLGHRRIGLIGDMLSRPKTTADKLAGYQRALREAGWPFEETLTENATEFGFEGGQGGFLRLAARAPDVTAVLCVNDPMALGVMTAAESLGRRCPEDLSVIGFGDFPEGRYWRPKLTTLTLSAQRVAEAAIGLVAEQRRQPRRETILIPEDLVVRESTGPAPRP